MTPVVDGSDTLAHALEIMRRDTRRFARRQRSWLRQVAGVRWHKPDETRLILDAVESFLNDEGRS